MRNIMNIVNLIRLLESDMPEKEKKQQIKTARNDGDITKDEALELALEYL